MLAESYNIPEDQLRFVVSMPTLSSRRIPVEDQKHGASERQVMLYKAKQMLKKARQNKDSPFKMVRTRKIPEVVGGAQHWRKRSPAFQSHRS